MQIEGVLLFDLDMFLKNFLQDIKNGKFPVTARSHGQVGVFMPCRDNQGRSTAKEPISIRENFLFLC